MSRAWELAQVHVKELSPYVPGTQPMDTGWVKLNTNECPYPPSPRVAEAVAAEVARLPLYPNPASVPLREAIARRLGVTSGQVLVGNGSDDVLNLLARVYCGRDAPAGQTFPSYSLYPVLTALQAARLLSVPFEEDMRLPVSKLAELRAPLLYLTAPNAPTGVGFALEELRALAEAFRGVLVVDEAYADFGDVTALPLAREYGHVVVTRSFSKSYALAGLRVGFAVASAEVVDLLDRVRESYNVNRLSQAGALAAWEDEGYLREVVAKVRATREAFRGWLEGRGWQVYPSQANFVFGEPVRQGKRGEAVARGLFEWLRERKILVRYFGGHALTAGRLRISIGTDADMARVREAMEQWEANA